MKGKGKVEKDKTVSFVEATHIGVGMPSSEACECTYTTE